MNGTCAIIYGIQNILSEHFPEMFPQEPWKELNSCKYVEHSHESIRECFRKKTKNRKK
jgi:hypothetical protein